VYSYEYDAYNYDDGYEYDNGYSYDNNYDYDNNYYNDNDRGLSAGSPWIDTVRRLIKERYP
uniref:hypothetical protein n=1 Tax=Veillonella magna TaxID=464322 RepID=UPI002664EE01